MLLEVAFARCQDFPEGPDPWPDPKSNDRKNQISKESKQCSKAIEKQACPAESMMLLKVSLFSEVIPSNAEPGI